MEKPSFENLWNEYVEVTPSARKIHALLEGRGCRIVNDHVAFRTFEGSRTGIQEWEKQFLAAGYVPKGEYHFRLKKVRGMHYERSGSPKIFMSELKVNQFSDGFKRIVEGLLGQVPEGFGFSGRPWKIHSKEYETLLKESEYGAWVAAFGFRANHFTVSVNELGTISEVAELNQILKDAGFRLNQAGGEIKGNPQVLLEQSSTMAEEVDVSFSDRTLRVPSCYYEFAKRYVETDGGLYQGFVEKSADRIFESTDRS